MIVSDAELRAWQERHFEMVELFRTEHSHMEASILQLAAGEIVRSKGPSRKRKERKNKGRGQI